MTTRVPIRYGGTGANTAEAARTSLGAAPSIAYDQANTAYGQANLAYAQANAAFTAANNGNLLLGGVITGTLNVTQDIIVGGNVYLEGNTTFINVATYAVEDSLIYLASNNQLTDSVDIGFMGGKNTGGTYAHTGLVRDATDAKWKLFDGLPEEGHVGNVVNFNNTYLATLVANVEANTLSVINGVSGNVNFDVGTLFVDSASDRIGIGTTLPTRKLHLSSSGLNCAIRIDNTTSGRPALFLYDDSQNLSFTNSSDTGYIGFINGTGAGVERMRIANTGNIGIGTTNPSSKLHILDSTGPVFRMVRTSNRFDVEVDNNAMGFVSRDSATANAYFSGFAGVGIGLTNPISRTHIDLSSGVNGLLIDTTYAGGAGGESVTSTAANTIYNAIFRSAYGTNAASVSNAGHKWGVLFTGYNGSSIGASQLQKSAGVFAVSEDPGAGYNRTVGLSLWTAPFDANITEKVRITGPGNVGIGTTTPSARLHVINSTPNSGQPAILADLSYGNTGDTSTSLRLNLNNGAGGGYLSGYNGELVVSHNSEFISGSGWVARSTTSSQIAQVSGDIIFYSNTGLTAGSTFTRGEKMRILTNGNVGVGTSNPQAKLHIAGDVILGNNASYNNLRIFSDSAVSGYNQTNSITPTTIPGSGTATTALYLKNAVSGGTNRIDLLIDGNVGVGTANPAAKLHVEGPAAIGTIGVEDVLILGRALTGGVSFQQSALFKLGRYTAAGGAFQSSTRLDIALKSDASVSDYTTTNTVMTLWNNGRVGIGTTDPSTRLDIEGSGVGGLLHINNTTSGKSGMVFQDNGTQKLIIGLAGIWEGNSSTDAVIATESGSNIRFYTNGSPTERIRIDTSGNVGIGTTNPATKLNVFVGDGGSNGTVGLRIGGTTNYESLELGIVGAYGAMFRSYGNDMHYYSGHWRTVGTGASEDHSHFWYTSKNGSANWSTAKMVLNHDGNLGIGTTNPLRPLQVNGIEISISSVGSGPGYTQGAFLSSSGTDTTPSTRGQGMFLFNEDNDVTWYLGTNYTSSDVFSINRKASTTSVDTSTAQLTHSLFSILSGGAIGVNFSGLNAAGYGQFAINWNPTNTSNNNGVGLAIRTSTATTDATFALFFNEGGIGIGSIKRTGTTNAVSFNTTSDRRLKENILPADSPSAIIDNIEIVKHDWKDGGHVRYGAVAQDLINIAPEAVSVGDPEEVENPRNPWGVDYSKLVPMLIKEIQELRARVSELENKVG